MLDEFKEVLMATDTAANKNGKKETRYPAFD